MKKLAIGISDFKQVIEQNRYYVDKTLLIKELIDSDALVSLIPRPRRFGKTLNLSMIRYFYETTNPNSPEQTNSHLFKELDIWQEPEEYRKKCGKHPVIYLTFKDVKYSNWDDCLAGLKKAIANEFERHSTVIENSKEEKKKQFLRKIISENGEKIDYENSLRILSETLFKIYNSNPVILIDEYDMPIQAGYSQNYYDQVIEFIRNLFSGGFKDNPFVERGVLTGILRVAKESIFSGLNNVEVCNLVTDKYSDKFGFLENEVMQLLAYRKIDYAKEKVIAWYNGYKIGKFEIFNPWSILEFVSFKGMFKPYWINSSGNQIVIDLITQADHQTKLDIEDLLAGKTIEKEIDDNIVYGDIERDSNSIWSFLFFSGYLKNLSCKDENRKLKCSLVIPNQEILSFYENLIINWFDSQKHNLDIIQLKKSLLSGDTDSFMIMFTNFAMNSLSYFDVQGNEPERFYHAFVLGMMFHLKDVYDIKSNRESGLGRYDVMLYPRNKANFGFIFEFKKVEKILNENLQIAVNKAIKQINEKNYNAELEASGIKKIAQVAIAFEGKKIFMKTIKIDQTEKK